MLIELRRNLMFSLRLTATEGMTAAAVAGAAANVEVAAQGAF